MFKFTESSQKLKYQVMIFSCVCLFIASSGSLPTEISVIGLDLSNNQNVSGWFLLIVTVYYLTKFLLSGLFDLIEQKLPNLILRFTKNLTGDVLGYTESEVHNDFYQYPDDQDESGSPSGELENIRRKREAIYNRYNRNFIKVRNGWLYISDFIFPMLFSAYSVYALHRLLKSGEAYKFFWWVN